jgi:hypothetical protein
LGAVADFCGGLASSASTGALAHGFPHLLARARKIVRGLEVHPKFRGVPEILREEKRGLGRDAALATNQFIDTVEGDCERSGKFGLTQSLRFEKLREENLAGMSCDAKFWQHVGTPQW